MNPLLPFALAALLAAPAIADPDMTPEEFFYEAWEACKDSRTPDECAVAYYRDATDEQISLYVDMYVDILEKADQFASANALRTTYRAFANLGRPGEGLEKGLRYAGYRYIP